MSVSSTASFEYLERLPGTSFARLYEQPSTALAIFRRMLPHLGESSRCTTWVKLMLSSENLRYVIAIHEQAISPE